ncbi:MAG: hypothetical protein CL609_13865 [Anaerolineaceae bacterium]|nr:hypothetical protein [Anaerolineaceae bacterium]
MFELIKNDLLSLSRRDFLKYSGAAFGSLFLMPLQDRGWLPKKVQPNDGLTHAYGRVISEALNVYQKPSLESKLVTTIWKDEVLPIAGVTIGEEEPAYNRIWYEMEGAGFVHSGRIQPVDINKNPIIENLPETGKLIEITVPYTDAIWHPKSPHIITYRLYFGTVYWVTEIVKDQKGKVWYKVPDDKWDIHYYVDAEHAHFIEPEEITPLSPNVSRENKWIEILLEEQAVIAYENERPIFFARTATGARFIDGDFRTQPGNYLTNRKRPSRHMAAGDPAAPNSYDLPGIPWICYLTESGISFHGTYWHNDYGKPRSHGCINLTPDDARWVYRWTLPIVPPDQEIRNADHGTYVYIH